jgi:hypothetical protein
VSTTGDGKRDLRFHYLLDCPCGTTLTGVSEDEIVQVSFAHLSEQHPEMADHYGREDILVMARRVVAP